VSSRIELAGTELHEALHGYVGGQDIDSGIDPLNDQIGAINHVLIYEAEAKFLERGGAEKDTINDRRQKKHQYLRQIKDPEIRKLVLQGRYAEAKKKIAEKSPSARFPKQPKSESPKPKPSRPQCDPPSSCPSPETK
jgi:hypothetical protein